MKDSKKAHIDIDPSSINKVIHVDIPIIGATGNIMANEVNEFKEKGANEVLGKPPKKEHIKGARSSHFLPLILGLHLH